MLTDSRPRIAISKREVHGAPSALIRGEPRDLAGLAEHLVDFAQMHFFFGDLLACVLFEEDRTVTHEVEQFFVKYQSLFLGFERLQQNVINAVLLGFEERAYL